MNKIKSSILLLCSVAFVANSAQADGSAAVFRVNPDSLRTQLLVNNISVKESLNSLYQAKDQLNISRAKLLPSVNLGVVMSPTFLLSQVSFLLPFLFPSNWFNMRQSKDVLNATTAAYGLVQLNQYASTYAIYETTVNDFGLRDVLQKQYDALNKIYNVLYQESVLNGNVSQKDLLQAQSQAFMAQIQLDSVDKLIGQEKAALRSLLAISDSTDIQFDLVHVPESVDEAVVSGDALQKLVDHALSIAPESTQIDWLISASKDAKWSAAFGWLSGSTLGTSSAGSGATTASFNKFIQSNTISLGFSLFPSIHLASDNVAEMILQKEALRLQENQIIEGSINSIAEAKQQVLLSVNAEKNMSQVYEMESQKYALGLTDLLHVLTAETQVTAASQARVQSQTDLDNLRINLHRALLTDQFTKVQGCQLQSFSRWHSAVSLDQACNPNAPK